MSIQVQHRRDTRATILTKTPAAGEIGYATDTLELTVGDGSTAGGAFVQRKNFREVLSPTALGSNTNDYAPTNYDAHCGLLRLTASTPVNLTGLTGGTGGRTIAILNAGANAITLKDASVSSSAANRFAFGADITLAGKQGVVLHYDGTGSLWYAIGTFLGAGPLLAANNLSDLVSASTARTNLGLGGSAVLPVGTTSSTVAAGDDSRITGAAQKASNLSDLANAGTSRTNLGLGTAAVQNTGTSGANVPLLNGANTHSGASTFSSSLSAGADAYLAGPLTPASLSSDANDYAPASFATSNFLRLAANPAVNITGLAGGTTGRVIALTNVGSFNITLKNQSASSSSANRFLFGVDLVISPQQGVLLIYDGVSAFWRAVSVFATAAGFLSASNNLSDVGNTITARANIGAAASGANGDITSLNAITGLAGGAFPFRGYIDGLTLSNDVGTPNTIIDIAAGAAAADDATQIMSTTALTKTTSGWAVGSGNGGLDAGSFPASSFLFAYLIKRTDTGVVDALLSLAPNASSVATMTIATPAVATWTNHGLQVNAPVVFTTTGSLPTGVTAGTVYYVLSAGLSTNSFQFSVTQGGSAVNTTGSQSGVHTATSAPQLPANYTKKRRIGAIKVDGASHILAFTQVGDEFGWTTAVLDVNSTVGTTPTGFALGSVPPGIVVNALVRGQINKTAQLPLALITPPTEVTGGGANSPAGNFNLYVSASGGNAASDFNIRTNTVQQITAMASTTAVNITIVTRGWIDTRGRNS